MKLKLSNIKESRLLVVCGLLLVTAVTYSIVLKEFGQYFVGNKLYYSWDSYTHYLRIKHLRDLYLPSGHHWGWDPYWFQGFIPFLLYAHLHYLVIAFFSLIFEGNLYRWYNIATLLSVISLPVIFGLCMFRMRGMLVALLGAIFVACLSCQYGGGPYGTLIIGLFSQQIGLCLFPVFLYFLFQRKLNWAATLMGLSWLVHIHTGLVMSLLWISLFFVDIAIEQKNRSVLFRRYLVYSISAFLISLPTLLGIIIGYRNIGDETGFGFPNIVEAFLSNELGLPWPILVTVVTGCLAVSVYNKELRERAFVFIFVFFIVLGLQNLNVDIPIVGKLLRQIFKLRILPFAYLLGFFVLFSNWKYLPKYIKLLSLIGMLIGFHFNWAKLDSQREFYSKPYLEGNHKSADTDGFERALAWLKSQTSDEPTTILMPFEPMAWIGHPIQKIVDHVKLPTLGGHGIELTNINNSRLLYESLSMRCDEIKSQIEKFAIGYILTGDIKLQKKFEFCLNNKPVWEMQPWSVFATGYNWNNFAKLSKHFSRNEFWTEMTWTLSSEEGVLTIPVANTGGWRARLDGKPTEITSGENNLISVPISGGSRTIKFKYTGMAGEWFSVFLSFCALIYLVLTKSEHSHSGN